MGRRLKAKKVAVRAGDVKAAKLVAKRKLAESAMKMDAARRMRVETARELAAVFVVALHAGSKTHREQLRRVATSAIIGRRQALDALCRLRAAGLVAEDLAGLGREELCGEWSGLWRLVEHRGGEMEADETEAALAGDVEARPKERSDRSLAALVQERLKLFVRDLFVDLNRRADDEAEGLGV